MTSSGCDLLCICPHTDDAEIALGGTLRLLADRGRRVWVCDLTRGELASNADPQTRWQEGLAASAVLGLSGRVQLALPDGGIEPSALEQVHAVVAVLRRLRPRWILTAPAPRRHPDHLATPSLVKKAAFLARLPALVVVEPVARWWPQAPGAAVAASWIVDVIGETCADGDEPTLLVDVSSTWPHKVQALACYASQFDRGTASRPTFINDPDFLVSVADQARRWGRRAGVERAEALRLDRVPVVDDLPAGRWA